MKPVDSSEGLRCYQKGFMDGLNAAAEIVDKSCANAAEDLRVEVMDFSLQVDAVREQLAAKHLPPGE